MATTSFHKLTSFARQTRTSALEIEPVYVTIIAQEDK